MAHGQGATSNRTTSARGTLGRGPRFATDPNKKKILRREVDTRWQTAKEETDAARAELDALMAQQRAAPAIGPVAGALYAAEEKAAKEKLNKAQAEQKAAEEADNKAFEEADAKPIRQKLLDPEPTESESGLPMKQPLWKFEKNFDPAKLPQEGDGNSRFAVTMAITKLKMGYHVTAVLEEFGIGVKDIPSASFDELGWGIRPDATEA